MNHDDHRDRHPDDPGAIPAATLDDALRWRLRALRQEAVPTRDLWPGIAARLPGTAPPRRARGWRGWRGPLAAAAGLLLAVGTVAWFARPRAPVSGPSLVQREAEGLTRQYRGALRELAVAPVPAELRPTLAALDRDAARVRAALAQAPDSRLLLEQLRRTYGHRLALARRLAKPPASA